MTLESQPRAGAFPADQDHLLAVSPLHWVTLAQEYVALVEKAPHQDYVVRTLAKRDAGNMPIMSGDLVIAGEETRKQYELARSYPLHFRKTYFPGRLHRDTKEEFESLALASKLIGLPPPIGYAPRVFRSCLIPGKPYSRLTPFGSEPEESNLAVAEKLALATAAGLWRFAEDALKQLLVLHDGGLAHGDAELHNFIACPAPLSIFLIDFESAVTQETLDDEAWHARCDADLAPLLREGIFLQCALGHQAGLLAEMSWRQMERLFRSPDRFRRAIDQQAGLRSQD